MLIVTVIDSVTKSVLTCQAAKVISEVSAA